VEIRIGVVHTAKEIDVDLGADADPSEVTSKVDKVLTGDEPVLWLTDRNGRQVGVPANRIAYIDIGSPETKSRIGFGAG